MAIEIRTFFLPDAEDDSARACQELTDFMRAVEIDRIDTAHAGDGWRLLVIYRPLKAREERAQIKTAIHAALIGWREKTITSTGADRPTVLPDDLAGEIATYAPTTVRELSVIVGDRPWALESFGRDVVQVVRATLDELIDDTR